MRVREIDKKMRHKHLCHETDIEGKAIDKCVAFFPFNPSVYVLKLAFFVVTICVFATVSINRTFCVELVIALLISCYTAIAPNLFALSIQCWAFSIKTVS